MYSWYSEFGGLGCCVFTSLYIFFVPAGWIDCPPGLLRSDGLPTSQWGTLTNCSTDQMKLSSMLLVRRCLSGLPAGRITRWYDTHRKLHCPIACLTRQVNPMSRNIGIGQWVFGKVTLTIDYQWFSVFFHFLHCPINTRRENESGNRGLNYDSCDGMNTMIVLCRVHLWLPDCLPNPAGKPDGIWHRVMIAWIAVGTGVQVFLKNVQTCSFDN